MKGIIVTLEELKNLVDAHVEAGVDPSTEVRIAMQPRWAMEFAVNSALDLVVDGADEVEELRAMLDDGRGEYSDADKQGMTDRLLHIEATPPVLYLSEGYQIGYLPSAAAKALGW